MNKVNNKCAESAIEEEWLTTEEAATYLKISKKQLLNLASDRKVPYYKLGSLNRYKTNELRRLLEMNRIPTEAENGNKTRSKNKTMGGDVL
jgi:excisionase family DNA binding protein